jgi:endo-1,4-beta-mannosidase
MWRDLDLGEVRADFAHMRDIGFRVVRFFLLTEDFLPGPMSLSKEKIGALVEVARIAREEAMTSIPTLVTINMSGKLWWPAWMRDAHGVPRDLYTDPTLLRSQALLVETCAKALAGDASIRAFDLSNEIDGAQTPPTRDAGWLWTALLAGAVRRAAPGVAGVAGVPIQYGAHLPSLTANNNMRIDDLAGVVDEDCMHAYPLYCDVARSFLDPELVPFSCALTAELAASAHGDPEPESRPESRPEPRPEPCARRAPLMHEFGICTAPRGKKSVTITDDFLGRPLEQYLASEDEGGRYYEEVLDRLAATGAAGAYAWCYGDYDDKLFDRAPLDTAIRERSFGIVRADGSEKPAAEAVRTFASRLADKKVHFGDAPRVLDVSADAYYTAPEGHFRRIYDRWLAARSGTAA